MSTSTYVILGIGILCVIEWLSSILDVIISDFKTQSNKVIWILLLIFVPPLGTILYMFMRDSQVIEKERPETGTITTIDRNDTGAKWF